MRKTDRSRRHTKQTIYIEWPVEGDILLPPPKTPRGVLGLGLRRELSVNSGGMGSCALPSEVSCRAFRLLNIFPFSPSSSASSGSQLGSSRNSSGCLDRLGSASSASRKNSSSELSSSRLWKPSPDLRDERRGCESPSSLEELDLTRWGVRLAPSREKRGFLFLGTSEDPPSMSLEIA